MVAPKKKRRRPELSLIAGVFPSPLWMDTGMEHDPGCVTESFYNPIKKGGIMDNSIGEQALIDGKLKDL